MLDALREPRSAYFGGGSGYLGSVFEERDDHRVTVRLRFDGLIRFSPAAPCTWASFGNCCASAPPHSTSRSAKGTSCLTTGGCTDGAASPETG